jgi:hypothetical protein
VHDFGLPTSQNTHRSPFDRIAIMPGFAPYPAEGCWTISARIFPQRLGEPEECQLRLTGVDLKTHDGRGFEQGIHLQWGRGNASGQHVGLLFGQGRIQDIVSPT